MQNVNTEQFSSNKEASHRKTIRVWGCHYMPVKKILIPHCWCPAQGICETNPSVAGFEGLHELRSPAPAHG